jgi:hypothetical protein
MTSLGRHRGEVDVYIQFLRNPALKGNNYHSSAAPPPPPPKRILFPMYKGWFGLGTSLQSMKNVSPTGIRSLDCPSRSELLYRQHHPERQE